MRARMRNETATLASRIGPQHDIGRLEAEWRATLGPTHQMQDQREEIRLGLNPRALPFEPSQQAQRNQESTGTDQSTRAPP